MKPILTLLALAALSLATTMARADDTASLDGWPAWVHEAMDAEAKRLKYRELTTPDESVTARLPGKAQDPAPMEGGWYFVSDIKAESPLECYLYTSSMDLATLTDVVAEANIEAVAGSADNVANRRVFHTSAGEVAGMAEKSREKAHITMITPAVATISCHSCRFSLVHCMPE